MEGDGREIFILRQKLNDRDDIIFQLRKESEANEDTIKMLKERNQQLTNQLLSAGVAKKEQKEVKPPLFHSSEQGTHTPPVHASTYLHNYVSIFIVDYLQLMYIVPSPTMPSLTQPQQSQGPYNIKEGRILSHCHTYIFPLSVASHHTLMCGSS